MTKQGWKAVTLDYVALSSFENDTDIAVCLTQRQVAILKSLLGTAYWQTRWTNLTITKDELESDIADIDYRLDGDSCEVFMYRQREQPEDLCQIQQSYDGGLTWHNAWRKDNCPQPISGDTVNNYYDDRDTVTTNNNIWNGDILNNAPAWEYIDEYNDRALCWAINAYIDIICNAAIDQIKKDNVTKRSANDWLSDVADVISLGVIAGLSTFVTGGLVLPAIAVGAIAWASHTSVDAIWDDLVSDDYDQFEDEEAKDVVKCMMFDSLRGVTPQFPAWRDSLSYFSSLGGNALAIARQVNIWNQIPDVFINHMILMQDIVSVKTLLPECGCPDRWEHTWNFATHGLENWRIEGDYGSYVEGVGIVADLRLLGGNYSNLIEDVRLGAEIDELIPRCDGFETYTVRIRGTFDSNVDSYVVGLKPPAPAGEIQGDENSGWFQTGEGSWRHNFPLEDYEFGRVVYMRSCFTAGSNHGSLILSSITLHGEGTDPFYGRITS